MPKPFMVERAAETSMGILLVGLVLMIIGVLAPMDGLSVVTKDVGDVILVVGSLLLIVGLIWTWSFSVKVRKFHSMLSENQKAVFIRNLDDVEYLAWKLPSQYEEELIERKKELGIR